MTRRHVAVVCVVFKMVPKLWRGEGGGGWGGVEGIEGDSFIWPKQQVCAAEQGMVLRRNPSGN